MHAVVSCIAAIAVRVLVPLLFSVQYSLVK